MDQKQIVIGVHGLLNKSPQNTIEQWWYQALQEGLIKNCNSHIALLTFKQAATRQLSILTLIAYNIS